MLTPGQASGLVGFDSLSSTIASKVVIADKGYDADRRVRVKLAGAGKTAVIPPRRNRKNPAVYDKELYKKRHHIENFFKRHHIEDFFGRLKDYRAIATPFEKTAQNFLSGIYLAAAIIWLD